MPADTVERELVDLVSAAKAKFLGLPTKGASLVMAAANIKEAKQVLERLVKEALDELVRDDAAAADGEEEGSEAMGPTPGPNPKRVGKPKPKAKPRGQRRARAVQ